MVRPTLLASIVLVSIATAFGGCSSSSTGAGGTDGGGVADSSNTHKEGGASSSSGSSSGSGDDSGGGDGSVTSACFANKAFTSNTYVPVVPHQGVCSATDIAAFVKACGDGTNTDPTDPCGTWQSTNSAGGAADGGGAGTACGNCILSQNGTNSASEVTFDSMGGGYFGPNYPGCIQLVDPTHGAACAAAQLNVDLCLGLECNLCTGTSGDGTDQDPQICDQAAAGATGDLCASALSTFQTACATDDADGGAASQCSPGSATNTQDPDWYFIIGLICGGGDAGSSSGGDGGASDAPTGG